MENPYKFLLAENPFSNGKFEDFIFSGRKNKRGLIKIKELDISDLYKKAEEKNIYTVYFTSKDTGLPEFYELSFTDIWDIPDNKINVILKDAGKWYKNYLIWEENQMNKVLNTPPLLKDYSSNIKGLKIIYSNFNKKWLVIFKGKIKIFLSEQDMNNWLINDMKIDEKLLNKGFINVLNV